MLCFCAHRHGVRCPRRALVPTMRRRNLQRHFPHESPRNPRLRRLRRTVHTTFAQMCRGEDSSGNRGYAVTHSMNIPFASAADVRLCFKSVAKAILARTGVLIAGHSNERSRSLSLGGSERVAPARDHTSP